MAIAVTLILDGSEVERRWEAPSQSARQHELRVFVKRLAGAAKTHDADGTVRYTVTVPASSAQEARRLLRDVARQ